MATLNWIATANRLSPGALTLEAQALPPNDQGNLVWDSFYTRDPVDSVDLDSITSLDYRPTADRREWNAPGRRVPVVVPTTRRLSMIPIEANFAIDEQELQKLSERTDGNEAKVQEQVMARIPDRTEMIAMSCWRRLEVDALQAWANGQIVQRNPEDASKTFTMSYSFPGTRYTTAGTAWDNAGVNAYTLLNAWITAAEDLVGTIVGAVLRLNILNAILADAPNLPNSVTMTRSQLQDRIQQDKGGPFELFVVENSVDVFNDGGLPYTRTKVWPAGKIAAVPAGGKIGRVAIAPTLRAWDVAAEVGANPNFSLNGVTIYPDVQNNGKRVQFDAQLNALPIPSETSLYVTATGIA